MPGWNDHGNKVVVTGQYLGPGEIATGCTENECCTGCTKSSCTTCGPASGCTTNYTKLTEKINFLQEIYLLAKSEDCARKSAEDECK